VAKTGSVPSNLGWGYSHRGQTKAWSKYTFAGRGNGQRVRYVTVPPWGVVR